jgi:hypothetical protein
MMDKIQKPGDSECQTPSSKPIIFYWEYHSFGYLEVEHILTYLTAKNTAKLGTEDNF